MASKASEQRLNEALTQCVGEIKYPEDDAIITAELPSSALTGLGELLERAREDVKASIRELSKLTAPDVDGWISQAKLSRIDIEDSKRLAAEIKNHSQKAQHLQSKVKDAAGKVDLLNGEVGFNEDLTVNLEQVYSLQKKIKAVEDASFEDGLESAMISLQDAKENLHILKEAQSTGLIGLFEDKIAGLTKLTEGAVTERWESCFEINAAQSSLTVHSKVQGPSKDGPSSHIKALQLSSLLEDKVSSLGKTIDRLLVTPYLSKYAMDERPAIGIDDETIAVVQREAKTGLEELFSDFTSLVAFLTSRLSPTIITPLSKSLMPSLLPRLISGPMAFSIRPDLGGVPILEKVSRLVKAFAENLEKYGWHGASELHGWIKQIPNVWLNRRREQSLYELRRLLIKGLGEPRTVERVETQKVSQEDNVFRESGGHDDWDAKWSDEEDTDNKVEKSLSINGVQEHVVDEDGSAWGLDDEEPPKPNGTDAGEDDADGDAWGWGDDDNHPEPEQVQPPVALDAPVQASRRRASVAPKEREVTLRENYNITAVPEQLLEIITQTVLDAESLLRPDNPAQSANPVRPAAPGLLSLSGLLLTMFRAIAPNFYARDNSGSMYLYNDSLYMCEQIRKFSDHHSNLAGPAGSNPFNVYIDVAALEMFGKRAYGKEMESQRTILGDLLDGGQGFTNSTEHPMAQECDLAIDSTVDRLRGLYTQWKTILSPSALLQSIGSLLSTVVSKIILDIEDMSDISEPESQRLTAFCNRIATLEDLFLPQNTNSAAVDEGRAEATMPLTAVHTRNWLKFQYLAQILESSLVDIKYLWTEGNLSMDFGAEEVVDLIEALFADSEHRRRAIGEIRRGVGRR